MVPALGSAAKKQKTEEPKTKLNAETLSVLELRNIGPAINSGRVVDNAVTTGKRHRFFAATASGANPETLRPKSERRLTEEN